MTKGTDVQNGRIVFIDVLRGYALLGILFCHYIHWHVSPYLNSRLTTNYTGFSKLTVSFNAFFLTNKFYILFSFIFGISFHLQSVRFKKYSDNIDVLFFRRAALLFLIGAIHFACWFSDILAVYGILTLPLIFLRRSNSKILLVLGTLLVMNLPGMLLAIYHAIHSIKSALPVQAPGANPLIDRLYDTVTKGNLADNLRFNLSFIKTQVQYQISNGNYSKTLGFMLYGLCVARSGILTETHLLKTRYRNLTIFAIPVLIGLQLLIYMFNIYDHDTYVVIIILKNILVYFNSVISITTNVLLAAVLFYTDAISRFVKYLAPLGKLALTNYLMQTLFGLMLFYHVGFGLFTITTPGENVFIAAAMGVLQIWFSVTWLKYFKYGPVEWFLRKGTLFSKFQ